MTDRGFEVLDGITPALESGTYTVSVHHELVAGHVAHDEQTPTSLTFEVGSGSVALAPDDVVACQPPPNSAIAKDRWYASVQLRRPGLPWERTAGTDPSLGGLPAPWLAVVLVRPAAAPRDRSGAVPTVRLPRTALPPDLATLASRCHVRVDPTGDEHAFVVSYDWLDDGGTWEAHLVSVEGAYAEGTRRSGDPIEVPSLHAWTFEVGAMDFADHVHALDHSPLRVPAAVDATPGTEPIDQGYVPLQHRIRDGSRTYSWFRGPLVAAGLTATPLEAITAHHCDHLLRVDARTGLLDVSLAAAFELGRLLTLRNQPVGVALHRWKRAWHRRSAENPTHGAFRRSSLPPGLAGTAALADAPPELPAAVQAWFDELRALAHVPFHYLVPDDRMLPPDSIRFFRVDEMWVSALLHGAAAIGGRPTVDDEQYGTDLGRLLAVPRSAGMLLRAGLVKDHPSLGVDGGSVIDRRLLSPDLLLVVFDASNGAPGSVHLHLAPVAMHLAEPHAPGTADDPTPSGARFMRARVSSGTTVEVYTGLTPAPRARPR